MSATHIRFGLLALNWRLTRSAGRWSAGSVTVVNTGLPRCTPRSPALRSNRRVCSLPRCQPLRFMAWCILFDPVDPVIVAVHPAQVGDELLIADLAIRRRPGPGGPITSGGEETRDSCPQNMTDELDPELTAMVADVGDHFVAWRSRSAAKTQMQTSKLH